MLTPLVACHAAGAGGNGAIIHYRAEKGSCKKVDKDTLLLLDSGGQFDCGTTDVTRTMHFGAPTDHQKMCFTRVLQVLLSFFSASLTMALLIPLLRSDPRVHFGMCSLDSRNRTVQFVSLLCSCAELTLCNFLFGSALEA